MPIHTSGTVVGAVDIGGTKIAAGIVDHDGKVLFKLESPTSSLDGYSAWLARIAEMIRESEQMTQTAIEGIGIGATGPVDPFTGEFGDVDFLPGWRGCNPVNDLHQMFKLQVAIENDGDAAALGEAGWGAAREKSRLIYVTVGTGIGGGIVFDGQLYRGVEYAHPEIGHQVLDPSGPLCSCGFHGCWEALAAGPAMVKWVQKQAAPDYPHIHHLTAKKIFQLAAKGEELALSAVKRQTNYMALGLANLVNMFTPDMIVLGGSVMKSAGLFLKDIQEIIRQGCRFVPFEKTELALASLGEDANLIGAARVWHHRFRKGTSIG